MGAIRATAVHATDERFRLLVESVKDYGIFMLTPEGNVATWNAGAESVKGYRAGEIIGKHFSIFYPPADVAAGKCEHELEVAARVGRFEDEGWRVRKDGTQFWANVTITPLRDPDGTLVGFAKVTRDLTARRTAEEEARRFRLLVESVKDYGIFILTPDGIVDTWNVGAERLKGYRAEEIIGKHFSIFYPPAEIAAGKCEHELEVAARVGRFEDEGWRLRKDGSRFWANVTITALHAADGGSLIGFAKVTRDLTDRKKTEEQLRQLAVEKAALAEKARVQEFQERFLAILGHDLRNPLAAIEMGTVLLRQQRSEDVPVARITDRIEASTRRMTRMIEQILDFTRTRLVGALEMNRSPMDLRAMLATIVDELRTAHLSRSIELRADAPLSGTWDGDRLEQVFSNLVGNAVHYGDPDKPVIVEARVDEKKRTVLVDVHNEGSPIPEALITTLFSPFRRGARDSRTAKTVGLGLGLYISQEIVVAHGGAIDVQSTASEGTTFRVALPLALTTAAGHSQSEGRASS